MLTFLLALNEHVLRFFVDSALVVVHNTQQQNKWTP